MGFEYAGKPASLRWRFIRRKDLVSQYLDYSKSSNSKYLFRLELSTDLKVYGSVHSNHLIKDYTGLVAGFWPFTDESLGDVLHHSLDLIRAQGISRLDTMSIPINRLPIEMSMKVLQAEDKAQAAATFMKEYELPAQPLDTLQAIILEKRTGEEDWEFMCGAAIYFGEYVIERKGGEWRWEDFFDTVAAGDTLPLKRIYDYWQNPHFPKFQIGYYLK